MKQKGLRFLLFLLSLGLSNCVLLFSGLWGPAAALQVPLYILSAAGWVFLCFFPYPASGTPRMKRLLRGKENLTAASWSLSVSCLLYLVTGILFLFRPAPFFISLAVCLGLHALLIVISLLRMLTGTSQLLLKWKLLAFFLWYIPVVHLFLFYKLCRLAGEEYELELEREELFSVRAETQVCAARYPVLLVHGVFFRDTRLVNYWGRIPRELIRNGARVYYGNQQSALSVADSARELKEKVLAVLRETGSEKVNIIAHSKGGLDSRYMIGMLGMADKVASLTTVNTPHHGCAFADYLLHSLPPAFCRAVEKRYNRAFRALGDASPDFMSAVRDLTEENCEALNRLLPDPAGVYCQSRMSVMKGMTSAPFPLNLTYLLVKVFSRENDGLVALSSAKWSGRFETVAPLKGRRGISHGDMIDLLRENIRGFDVRKYYVDLVADLKNRGY